MALYVSMWHHYRTHIELELVHLASCFSHSSCCRLKPNFPSLPRTFLPGIFPVSKQFQCQSNSWLPTVRYGNVGGKPAPNTAQPQHGTTSLQVTPVPGFGLNPHDSIQECVASRLVSAANFTVHVTRLLQYSVQVVEEQIAARASSVLV